MNYCLRIDHMDYDLEVSQPIFEPVDIPRLVIVSYLPNQTAVKILQACMATIQKFTVAPHELWVVDNNSPSQYKQWLLNYPDVNIIFNKTQPSNNHRLGFRQRFKKLRTGVMPGSGSYANAIALEIAARIIDPESRYMMPLHMDTMPCRHNWLSFLLGKVQGNFSAAGVRLDKARTPSGVLHVLGYIVDFQLFQQLQLSFLPDLPQFDVGDKVTVELRKHGYAIFSCRNTLWQPELIEHIPLNPPFRHLHVGRALDDEGNVIFLHLGRGIKKSSVGHDSGANAQEWLDFAEKYLLSE